MPRSLCAMAVRVARLLAVRDSQLLSDVLRIFQRRVAAWYRLEARRLGFRPSEVQPGSVTAIQLFGGAVNLNPHFHSIFADGVFCGRADGGVEFVPALSPTDEDVARICGQVAWRVQRLVQRRLEAEKVRLRAPLRGDLRRGIADLRTGQWELVPVLDWLQ